MEDNVTRNSLHQIVDDLCEYARNIAEEDAEDGTGYLDKDLFIDYMQSNDNMDKLMNTLYQAYKKQYRWINMINI